MSASSSEGGIVNPGIVFGLAAAFLAGAVGVVLMARHRAIRDRDAAMADRLEHARQLRRKLDELERMRGNGAV